MDEEVYNAHKAYRDAKENFEFFAEHQHNSQSIASAYVHANLLRTMDEAKAFFRPYENAWSIAKKGYSLN